MNFKIWMAELLLGWAFDVSPWNEEGQKIRRHISNYYIEKLEEKNDNV